MRLTPDQAERAAYWRRIFDRIPPEVCERCEAEDRLEQSQQQRMAGS